MKNVEIAGAAQTETGTAEIRNHGAASARKADQHDPEMAQDLVVRKNIPRRREHP